MSEIESCKKSLIKFTQDLSIRKASSDLVMSVDIERKRTDYDFGDHACIGLPEGWYLGKNYHLFNSDGIDLGLMLQEVGRENDNSHVKCILPGCTYERIFKTSSLSSMRRKAEGFHRTGYQKKLKQTTSLVQQDATTCESMSSLLTVFVPKGQMTEASTVQLLKVCPQFETISFKADGGQIVKASDIYEFLDEFLPLNELRQTIQALETMHPKMHPGLLRSLWNDVKDAHSNRISGAAKRVINNWTKEHADLMFEKEKLEAALEATVTHGTVADFNQLYQESLRLQTKLWRGKLGKEANLLERAVEQLNEVFEKRQITAKAKPFYKLLRSTSKPIEWDSYLYHQVSDDHVNGIQACYEFDFGDAWQEQYSKMLKDRMPVFQGMLAKHSDACAVDAIFHLPETGEDTTLLLSSIWNIEFPVDFLRSDQEVDNMKRSIYESLPEATPSLSKTDVDWKLSHPTKRLKLLEAPKEGPFASFLRACKESSIAYETRSEAPAQFKIALDKSCQLMSAEDEHINFQSLHSRYHFYCDSHGFEFQEGQLTPDALAEYNLQYTSDGNGKVFGLKMVTPEEETVEVTPSTSTSVSHNLEAQLFGDNLPPRPKWHK